MATQLGGGNPTTYVPNIKTIPGWGVLRFDLHVPNPEPATDPQGKILPQNSVLKVCIDGQELLSSAYQGLDRRKELPSNGTNDSASEYPAVDLREFNPKSAISAGLNSKLAEAQSNRIGFAQTGFQTFQVDIPNQFRGKGAKIEFKLSGGKTVYLDNVFIWKPTSFIW